MDNKETERIQRNNSANRKTFIQRRFNPSLPWKQLPFKNTKKTTNKGHQACRWRIYN